MYKIYSVARYIREVLSGDLLSEEEIAVRDAEWEELGGGKDLAGGGGHGGHYAPTRHSSLKIL